MSALPLQQIEGKYEILEKLREGGMGAIYKVRHRLLDEVRVIKLMRQQLVDDEELKTRFVREARLAIKLRHPNIAQLYDFTVDDDGTAFIVMEYIDGMTLEDVLKVHGPPPLGFGLEIAQQSLKALGYLHVKGFIHRDISPDNLMLTADMDSQPLVKLIDLGIAKILGGGKESHLTQTGTFLGKIRYAPPEQFGSEGSSTVDTRGDLYSFGVVLYELLTGRFPIQGRDPSSLIAGHLFRPPLDFAETDPQGRVSAGLREVVLKALAKKPDERFASAAELSRALAAFRNPGDVNEEELNRLLTRPFIRMGPASVADPGSTQDRLDENFNLAPTPSPGNLLEVVPPLPPPTNRSPSESKVVRDVAGTIGLQLQQGELLTAEAELRWALDAYGEQPELRTLRDRLAEMKLREAEARARDLCKQARGLFDSGDLEAARERLQEARTLDPRNADVASLLELAEQRIQHRNEEQERAREVAAAVAEIEAVLARKDYRVAETLLYGAEARFGEREELPRLHVRVEELRRRDLAGKVDRHLETARRLVGARDFPAALDEIQRARRLDPESRAAASLLAEVETARERQQEVAGLIAGARDLATREDFAGALKELRRAADLEPDHPEVSTLVEEVEAASRQRSEEQRQRQVAARLGEARQLAAEERYDDALAVLRHAAELAPDPEVQTLTQEVRTAQRWQREEKRKAAELALAAATLEGHLGRGELTDAAKLLEKTVAAHGDRGPLPELRNRLETLRTERSRPAPEPTLRRGPEPEEEIAEVRPETPAQPEPVAVPPPPRPEPVAEPLPKPAPRWKLWAVVGAGVLLLVVGTILFLARRGETPASRVAVSPIPATPTPAPTPGTAPIPGTLILDAIPWGEVVEVVDGNGKPQPLGPQRYTPLVLSLPPGRYTVTLRNPSFPKPVSLNAEVLTGSEVRSVAELGAISEEELFRGMGW